MNIRRCVVTLIVLLVMAVNARAEVTPLIGGLNTGPLVQVNRASGPSSGGSSLFIGQSGSSLFAPYPQRQKAPIRGILTSQTPPEARLLTLIASAEAGPDGYDAVQHGASRRPSKRPTDMTIGEIYDWITATPGQPHAIGRYQFIPPTLRTLTRQAGFNRQTPFTPAVQDELAGILLQDAGLAQFQAGGISRHAFMNNLAKIWAGLPTSSGRSYYHGYAGNSATMTWARYDAEMTRIYPG
ncbi:MAG: hypothetical protein ABJO29_03460 [Yoonia sp.]|uniref:hypothetical protein n=1 Tax=Yoonia sp. TaxID=2212373 RepID=UPI0021F9995B|nr:hypothetical protein K3729_04500 [Rhodobacteraceae bacterium S2214]